MSGVYLTPGQTWVFLGSLVLLVVGVALGWHRR